MCVGVMAQSPAPKGLPAPYSTGYYRIGWLQSDSGSIAALRSPTFVPKFPGTEVFWINPGVDSSKWIWNGSLWVKELKARFIDITQALGYIPIQLSSLSATFPIVYNNATGVISCPSCGTGGGGGGITSLNGVTAGNQNFATGLAGTNFNISSNIGTGIHTFNIPIVSSLDTGLMTPAMLAQLNAQALSNGGSGYRLFNPVSNTINSLVCSGCTLDSTTNPGSITLTAGGAAIPPNIGAGFRVYSPQTPGFNTFFAGTGITIDSTTNANGITITASGGASCPNCVNSITRRIALPYYSEWLAEPRLLFTSIYSLAAVEAAADRLVQLVPQGYPLFLARPLEPQPPLRLFHSRY